MIFCSIFFNRNGRECASLARLAKGHGERAAKKNVRKKTKKDFDSLHKNIFRGEVRICLNLACAPPPPPLPLVPESQVIGLLGMVHF